MVADRATTGSAFAPVTYHLTLAGDQALRIPGTEI
ncbi:hypothetical protein CLV96_2382 [Leptospira meyeri]|uniref:Uncharacterized protein n=1 Tax=Leptospira meyeri TaxID=29508 RepID=A0A4R8N0I8_LEPME|nr:hypothetical protein CLV96_2382 [Leptospira meyeri]